MAIIVKPSTPKVAPATGPKVATLKENDYMSELGFSPGHNGAILEASTKAIADALEQKPTVATPKIDHLKAAPSNGSVEVTITQNNYGEKKVLVESKKQETMGSAPIPLDKLHNLNVGGKMTINLGNYQSAQIHCSLTVPCTKESLEDAYQFASDWVSNKIEQAVSEAKKGAA